MPLIGIEISDIKNYVSFLNYFEKNWLKYEQKFVESDYKLKWEKTNNPCEIFNKLLNSKILIKSPRISYLIDQIFIIVKNKFQECCESLISPKKIKIEENNFEFELIKYKNMIIEFIENKDIKILFDCNIDNEENNPVYSYFSESE